MYRGPSSRRKGHLWRFRASNVWKGSGFTIIELLLAMIILAVSMMMFATTVASVAGEQAINRENIIAADGARTFLERLRNEDVRLVFARFNQDEADDPGGPGTAPGSRFAVEGLNPGAAPDGLVGEIFFPAVDVAAPGEPVDLELRESSVDARFGLPRDLSGDSIIDSVDHTSDYLLLPVEVRINWMGQAGVREFRMFATLCEFNWS